MLLSWGTQKPDSLNNFLGRCGIEAFLKDMKSKGRNISELTNIRFSMQCSDYTQCWCQQTWPKTTIAPICSSLFCFYTFVGEVTFFTPL